MKEVEGRGEAGGGDLLSGVNEVDGRGELGEAGPGGFLIGGGVLSKPPIAVRRSGKQIRPSEAKVMEDSQRLLLGEVTLMLRRSKAAPVNRLDGVRRRLLTWCRGGVRQRQ